jgi:hypothetical protein
VPPLSHEKELCDRTCHNNGNLELGLRAADYVGSHTTVRSGVLWADLFDSQRTIPFSAEENHRLLFQKVQARRQGARCTHHPDIDKTSAFSKKNVSPYLRLRIRMSLRCRWSRLTPSLYQSIRGRGKPFTRHAGKFNVSPCLTWMSDLRNLPTNGRLAAKIKVRELHVDHVRQRR